MGQEGDTGEKGEIGLKGKEGPPGSPGLTGVRVNQGSIGPKSGPPGKRGFRGGMGLPGPRGDPGPKGQPVSICCACIHMLYDRFNSSKNVPFHGFQGFWEYQILISLRFSSLRAEWEWSARWESLVPVEVLYVKEGPSRGERKHSLPLLTFHSFYVCVVLWNL
uniref:Uncharacterized protein n=1 Tax=Salarias fasciatus TaxID=181472 RepID=A0A672HTF7_SALFA